MSRSDIGESDLSVSPAGDIKDAARGISNENKKIPDLGCVFVHSFSDCVFSASGHDGRRA